MATEARRNDLLLALDNLLTIWTAWSKDQDTPYMTRAFEEAVDDCLTIFGDGSIPGDMRLIHDRIESLREHWAAWNEKNAVSGGKYPIPGNEFWKALENIDAAKRAIVKPVRRRLEPLSELLALNPRPTDAQLCRMYGFTESGLPDGKPDLVMLQEEIAKPGRHTGPETGWLPPHEKRARMEEIKQQAAIERINQQRAAKLANLTRVAPEPIEQLVVQGVSGKQICKMKKIGRAELETYCQEHGLPTPGWEAELARAIKSPTDFDPDEDDVRPRKVSAITLETVTPAEEADGEPMTLEQEIVMYHQQGISPTDIAAAVSREGNEVNHQKVGKVIARWKADPSAFETVGSLGSAGEAS